MLFGIEGNKIATQTNTTTSKNSSNSSLSSVNSSNNPAIQAPGSSSSTTTIPAVVPSTKLPSASLLDSDNMFDSALPSLPPPLPPLSALPNMIMAGKNLTNTTNTQVVKPPASGPVSFQTDKSAKIDFSTSINQLTNDIANLNSSSILDSGAAVR